MRTAARIIDTVEKLTKKYDTRDPYELCKCLGIKIHFYDMEKKLKGFFFYQSRQKNDEANFFAAELLLEDQEVLDCLLEYSFFETAKKLYVPAALLDYKFSLLHEKGELVNSMYIRKSDFLREDLGDYDEANHFSCDD